jgi:hypothetical protein
MVMEGGPTADVQPAMVETGETERGHRFRNFVDFLLHHGDVRPVEVSDHFAHMPVMDDGRKLNDQNALLGNHPSWRERF